MLARAYRALMHGSPAPLYSVCRRIKLVADSAPGSSRFEVLVNNLSWAEATALVEPMPRDWLVCMTAPEDSLYSRIGLGVSARTDPRSPRQVRPIGHRWHAQRERAMQKSLRESASIDCYLASNGHIKP